jgi:hypothetical protein
MGLDFIVINKGDFSAFRNYLIKYREQCIQVSLSVFIPILRLRQRTLQTISYPGVSVFVLP